MVSISQYMQIPNHESLHHTPETNMLHINYTSKKLIFNKKGNTEKLSQIGAR